MRRLPHGAVADRPTTRDLDDEILGVAGAGRHVPAARDLLPDQVELAGGELARRAAPSAATTAALLRPASAAAVGGASCVGGAASRRFFELPRIELLLVRLLFFGFGVGSRLWRRRLRAARAWAARRFRPASASAWARAAAAVAAASAGSGFGGSAAAGVGGRGWRRRRFRRLGLGLGSGFGGSACGDLLGLGLRLAAASGSGCVARVSGAIVTSSTAIGISSERRRVEEHRQPRWISTASRERCRASRCRHGQLAEYSDGPLGACSAAAPASAFSA